MTLDELKAAGEAPEWMQPEGYATIMGGYLLPNETPLGMYLRLAKAAGSQNPSFDWGSRYFEAMWKGWLCPASPVLANLGTTRGFPISCNAIHVGDSIDSIFMKQHELAMLSKNGAGVAVYMGDIRGRDALITGNGRSEGIIPWCKGFDTTTVAVNQGTTRRGATAVYLPIDHADIDEFLQIRRPTGDANRRCLNLNHAVTVTDAWMESMLAGDSRKRQVWGEVLKARMETGQPYIINIDTINNANPPCYAAHGLSVKTSNLCSEIALHTDVDHSFVCCLSSLNLSLYDEWKDTDLVEVGTRFLDAVMEEYIQKSDGVPGLAASRRSAIKGRSVGLGVLGFHTLLQKKNLPFDHFQSMSLNAQIFRQMHEQTIAASKLLAIELGEPEWCVGTGMRNTHLMALAPTVSNAMIAGGVSPSIEPWAANIFSNKSAKGTFISKNPHLEALLETKGKNTPETWKSINEMAGSVAHLKFLSSEEQAVFLTAREINQFTIVKMAAQRAPYVDQAQSINLFFGTNSNPKYINEVHVSAWKLGVKSLYYMRSAGVLRGDMASRSADECAACEG